MQYRTLHYPTKQCNTVQNSAIHYRTVQYSTEQCNIGNNSEIQNIVANLVQYRAGQNNTVYIAVTGPCSYNSPNLPAPDTQITNTRVGMALHAFPTHMSG